MMKHVLSTVVVACGLAAPAISSAAGVPAAIENAWSMSRLGYYQTHLNYAENGSTVLSNNTVLSGTLDTEKGTLHGIYLDGNHQWSHIGFKLGLDYASGNTAYDGHLLTTGAPVTGTTQDKVFDVDAQLRYAFSFAAIPNLAFVPAIEGGVHLWDRSLGDGNDEVYFNEQWMGELGLAYAVAPSVVLSAGYGAGKTVNPKMHSSSTGNTYTLGAGGIHKEWVELEYTPESFLGLFAKYQAENFKYKASAAGSNGMYEPDSTTKLNTFVVGITYGF